MRERVYLALVHHPTLDREGKIVATAVTPLDLHDLARLARTYGLGGVYVTTPLAEQRSLVGRLLEHWVSGHGGEVNPCRREALRGVRVVEDLTSASAHLESRYGGRTKIVATSARNGSGRIGFSALGPRLEETEAPVLLLFGTGWGLAPSALEECDHVLEPIEGGRDYNHLSVRSAASIVVDRLFAATDRGAASPPGVCSS